MPDYPRRELLKRAAALGVGAMASTSRAFAGASPGSGEGAQSSSSTPDFFPGFKRDTVKTTGASIHYVTAGSGPPLLLLHGYPQTHIEWREVAAPLAKKFTVVAADLRGYGDSSKPADGENHLGYSKRAMAQDQVEMMASLGFQKFAVVGHDRGGRVAYRLALDHPGRLELPTRPSLPRPRIGLDDNAFGQGAGGGRIAGNPGHGHAGRAVPGGLHDWHRLPARRPAAR